MVSRRSAIQTVAAAPWIGPGRATKPNFLFIIGDDHAGYVLGADGNRQALTPNLDRLGVAALLALLQLAGLYAFTPVNAHRTVAALGGVTLPTAWRKMCDAGEAWWRLPHRRRRQDALQPPVAAGASASTIRCRTDINK
jgi:hypothetical protein